MKHIGRALLKVVHLIAQVGLLRVVEVDHVLAGSNRQRFLICAGVVVAVDLNHFVLRLDHIIERHLALNLLFVKHLVRVLLKVVHRVAQIGSLRVVEGNHVLGRIRRYGQILTRRVYLVVALNVNRRFRYSVSERLLVHGLCLVKHLVRVLLKVVHRVAQIGSLRVVEGNHVLGRIRRYGQILTRRVYLVVALNVNRRFVHLRIELLVRNNLIIRNRSSRSFQIIMHRVAQVLSLFEFRMIHRAFIQTGVIVFIQIIRRFGCC